MTDKTTNTADAADTEAAQDDKKLAYEDSGRSLDFATFCDVLMDNFGVETKKTPAIYPAMIRAMKAIGAVEKSSENTEQKYRFRSIDDFYNAAQPALADAGIFILPTYEEIAWTMEAVQKSGRGGQAYTQYVYFSRLRGTIRFVSEVDGSSVECVTIGEARDFADKATNKAETACLKWAIQQVFLVTTKDVSDADQDHITIETQEPTPETREQAKHAMGCLVAQLRVGNTSDLSDGDFLLAIGEDLFPGVDSLSMTTEQIWAIREAMRNGLYDLDTGDKIPTETKDDKDA